MSPELFFWYGLALKMVMTATIVVVASVAVERSGPFIGALIASLPSAAGAAYIILAIEHPPAFIAGSAVGSLAANAAVAIFALAYAVLAQRHGIVLSLSIATLIWLVAAAGLRSVDWTPVSAIALNALVYAVTIPVSARYRGAAVPREKMKTTWRCRSARGGRCWSGWRFAWPGTDRQDRQSLIDLHVRPCSSTRLRPANERSSSPARG